MWKNTVVRQTDRQATVDNTVWPRNDATMQTQPKYLTLTGVPWQQQLHKHTSILRYWHVACVVITQKQCVHCMVETEVLHIILVRLGV